MSRISLCTTVRRIDFVNLNPYLFFSDPVVISVKSSTSYAQEDLDLINSEISNLEHSASPLLSEARTPKSDSCGETTCSTLESSTHSLNLPDNSEIIDNKVTTPKEDSDMETIKGNSIDSTEMKVNTVAMQLGIVEPVTEMKTAVKDLIIKEEFKNIKLSTDKEFDKSESKSKISNRNGLNFFPGCKLEAKDFSEKWQVLLQVISNYFSIKCILRKNLKFYYIVL